MGRKIAGRLDVHGPERDGLQDGREEAVLFDEDSRRQRVNRVSFEHGDDRLRDDGPRVHAGVDEVDRAAGETNAVRQSLGLCVGARKSREKRRVDVDHPHGEGAQKHGRHEAHEPGEHRRAAR